MKQNCSMDGTLTEKKPKNNQLTLYRKHKQLKRGELTTAQSWCTTTTCLKLHSETTTTSQTPKICCCWLLPCCFATSWTYSADREGSNKNYHQHGTLKTVDRVSVIWKLVKIDKEWQGTGDAAVLQKSVRQFGVNT